MTDDRRGFSLIELMIVVLIIATIAGIAIPNMQRALLRARAVDAMADLNAIRVAVLNYQADEDSWPPDAQRGDIPTGLEPYLPGGFSFARDEYLLDYENWMSGPGLVGASIRTSNTDLGLMLMDLLGNNTFISGDGYVWVFEWTS